MSKWILFVSKHSILFLLLTFGLFALSSFFVKDLNVEAFPDPAPPVLEIVALDPGKSAEEIERQITIPTEIALAGMIDLQKINTSTLYGLCDIKCRFSYDISYRDAKQEVLNRLAGLSLPDSVTPSVVSNPIGEVMRYTVQGSSNLMELRTLLEWVIARHLLTADGVEDVTIYGGYRKDYEVKVLPENLIKYGISLSQVLSSLSNSNLNVGARELQLGDQYYVVRGIGLIKSLKDIEDSLVTTKNGKPILIKNIAQVSIGNVPRTGIMGYNHQDDSVVGYAVLRKGAQSIPSLKSIHEKIKELNDHILPKGIHINIYYDRWDLIVTVVKKVLHTASIGIILVVIALFIFLGDFRGAFVVALSIPISLLITLSIMAIRGESANFLSIGAIDYGIIVDIPLILMENYYRLTKKHGPGTTTITKAAEEVNKPIFFSVLIIFLAFLPLFMMQGAEGQIFSPMAKTYLYAISITLVLTFTYLIASQYTILGKSIHKEFIFVGYLRRKYIRVVQKFQKQSTIILVITVLVFSVNLFLGIRMLSTEFIPKMDEGNMYIRITFPYSISLDKAFDNAKKVRDLIMTFPEVQGMDFKAGRPEDGSDPTGPSNTEYTVLLKPYDQWKRKISKEQLEDMTRKDLSKLFPNADINISQYIEDNIEEMMSGVKGENSIKIYGNDLKELDRIAVEVNGTLEKIPGITDVGIFRELGQPNLLIEVNRENASAMGLAVQDVLNVVQASLGGGQPVTQVIEGEKSFDLVVNFPIEYRQNPEKIANIPMVLPDGSIIPLSRVANIHYDTGASFIFRENFNRFIPVKFTVIGNDLGGTVAQAQKEIAKIKMPEGYYVEWSGIFNEMEEAFHRFYITIPLTLFIILTILYIYFKSVRNIMITMFAPAFDIFGGVLSLLITSHSLSISSMVGFISIIGISILNASILISHYIDIHRNGRTKEEAVIEASEDRFRPVLMGGLIASLGLLPTALMHGVGSQVQKPLAIVVVGGMFIDTLMILLVMPLLLKFVETNNE